MLAITIPVEKWLLTDYLSEESEESSYSFGHDLLAATDMKSRLRREHHERRRAEERIWELEQANERFLAEIRLRERFVQILRAEVLSKNDKSKRLKKLAAWVMEEGILNFDEIQRVLKVKRSVLRNWLEVEKKAYDCRFADNGHIFAPSPGAAALCLRCFDCAAFELGECRGHGNEKRPENIVELLERLRANSIYDSAEQSRILEEYYDLPLSAYHIINIRYRTRNGLPIPDDVFYMDMRGSR